MSYTDIFTRCIEVILKNEGGYVNHSLDPGGETNMGITKRNYPDLDIKNLTKNEAIQIYFRDYWNKMNLKDIKDENLILQIFDMGVNAGPKTAIKIIQRIVNADVDGVCGNQTTELINSFPNYSSSNESAAVICYKAERRKYYFDLVRRKPNQHIFLTGWINRIEHTKFS